MCMFILSTKHLMVVYMYLMSVGLVLVSYWSNLSTIRTVASTYSEGNGTFVGIIHSIISLNLEQLISGKLWFINVIQNHILQSLISIIFINIHLGPRHPLVQKMLPVCFMAPSILAFLPLPPFLLNHSRLWLL